MRSRIGSPDFFRRATNSAPYCSRPALFGRLAAVVWVGEQFHRAAPDPPGPKRRSSLRGRTAIPSPAPERRSPCCRVRYRTPPHPRVPLRGDRRDCWQCRRYSARCAPASDGGTAGNRRTEPGARPRRRRRCRARGNSRTTGTPVRSATNRGFTDLQRVDAAFMVDGLAMAADQLDRTVPADGAQDRARRTTRPAESSGRKWKRDPRRRGWRIRTAFGVRRAHEPDRFHPPATDLNHRHVDADPATSRSSPPRLS